MINGLDIFYTKANKGNGLKLVENKGEGLKIKIKVKEKDVI